MTSTTTIADVATKISGVTNRGAWTNTPTSSGKVTIPKGYHNGSGYVDTSKVYSTVSSIQMDVPLTLGKKITTSSKPKIIIFTANWNPYGDLNGLLVYIVYVAENKHRVLNLVDLTDITYTGDIVDAALTVEDNGFTISKGSTASITPQGTVTYAL